MASFYTANPKVKPPVLSYDDYYLPYTQGGTKIIVSPSGVRQEIIPPWVSPPPSTIGDLLRSKNNLTDNGFTIGGTVNKDMGNANYTALFNPNNFQNAFFPGMADFIDENIVAGDKDDSDRLTASYWNDLGNDVFDRWGYFYLYDVSSGKYYFPIISPQDDDDGVITTQIFNAFGRIFTIAHGWTVQGIFKFDISVDDTLPFRFGAYGNMGFDSNGFTEDLTNSYSVGSTSLTLYYHHNGQNNKFTEQLYSYFIPKQVSENDSQTYNAYYALSDDDMDNMSIISKEVTHGLIVYFSKTNNVKEWVANDLEVA